jgi:metal-responsive CopG/Arc/MetJ family transcriptional regulator
MLWMEFHMETIQVILDSKLLRAADRAAKKRAVNRSALVREALTEYLRRLQISDLEERDRKGYRGQPQQADEYLPLEAAAWPAD